MSLIAIFSLAACQNGGAGESGTADESVSAGQSSAEKTEEELMAENELFADAIPASESFVHNGITFRVTSVFVTFSPNDDNPTKTIKVYVDYPYEIKTVAYDDFPSSIPRERPIFRCCRTGSIIWGSTGKRERTAG